MRKRMLLIATLTCVAVSSVPVATAGQTGIEPGTLDNGLHICEEQYLAIYAEAAKELGSQALGVNLVDDGALDGYIDVVSNQRACDEAEQIDLMLHPVVVEDAYSGEEVAGTEYVPAEPTEVVSSGGVSNATVMCESGGDYGIDTGNGYYGGYQFDTGTWDAYGDSAYGEANEAPPAVQDAAAASVPYDAWPNC